MRNRSLQLNIRLTEAEHKKLMNSITKSKFSVSAYIRSLIEGNSPKECPPLEYHELIQKLQDISAQLTSIFHLVYITRQFDKADVGILEKEMMQYKQILLAIQAAVLLPEKAV